MSCYPKQRNRKPENKLDGLGRIWSWHIHPSPHNFIILLQPSYRTPPLTSQLRRNCFKPINILGGEGILRDQFSSLDKDGLAHSKDSTSMYAMHYFPRGLDRGKPVMIHPLFPATIAVGLGSTLRQPPACNSIPPTCPANRMPHRQLPKFEIPRSA